MKLRTSLGLSWNFLVHSKLRSWLTIIGIIIGMSAVVAIVSLGEGLSSEVNMRFGEFGADLITITAGGSRAMVSFRGFGGAGGFERSIGGFGSDEQEPLTIKDVQVIRSVENVEFVAGSVRGSAEIYYLSEKANVNVEGIDPIVWPDITTSGVGEGRLLGPADHNSVILGYSVAHGTFKQDLVLNRQVIINDKTFKIVGILEEGDDDRAVIMIEDAAREILDSIDSDEYSSITVKASDDSEEVVNAVIESIDGKLMLSRHIVSEDKKDFSVSSPLSMQETIESTSESITVFLGAIAAVSLLVGGVGVANTMFTSVLEKTKDIGVMKAIGAKNSDILIIFLLNSSFVGLVGGFFGVILGVAFSALLPLVTGDIMFLNRTSANVSVQLVVSALLLSFLIGGLAGFIPAYRASKLKPVDALRYE